VHSREMKVIERYSDLGADGKDLAMLLLRMGRGRPQCPSRPSDQAGSGTEAGHRIKPARALRPAIRSSRLGH